MTQIEDARVLSDLSDGAVVPRLLEERARHDGERVFIRSGESGIALTYEEAAVQAGHIAGNLAAAGVGPGDRVSVMTRNALLAVQWMFGIWRAGAVYCPVNFNYRGRLLAYQLADSAPALLVTDQSMTGVLAEVAGELPSPPPVAVHHVSSLEEEAAEFKPLRGYPELAHNDLVGPASPPTRLPEWHEPANVFYTSGTTGPSKGVVQNHRWMDQYTWAARQLLTRDDVIYNDLPLYHVGGAIYNVVRAVCATAEVSLWEHFSSSRFWDRVRTHGATSACLLDVMIPWLMSAAPSESDPSNTLNKVHMQPLPLHHHDVAQRFGFDFVSVAFGQTESGAPLFGVLEETEAGEGTPRQLYRGHSHAEIQAIARRSGFPWVRGRDVIRKGYMGRPLPFAEAAVLDEQDTPCAPGDAGELVIRPRLPGVLFERYHAAPDATARALRNAWFHTGDSAVVGDDGAFYFIDRLGDRIRRHGENVSSFHVEDLLNQHPDVRASAVIGVPAEEGDEDEVVAFIEPRDPQRFDVARFETWAASYIPKFMCPQHVRLLDALPRTPTNKVEKYKLRADFRRLT